MSFEFIGTENEVLTVSKVVASLSDMKVSVMPVDEFIAIEDNPQQRDTELHAAKAQASHLAKADVSHREVAAAELPDGKLIKLDGHTRCFLWASGDLKKPDALLLKIFPVENMDEAIKLYEAYDSNMAVKTSADSVQSAYNLAGLTLKSTLLRSGTGVEKPLRFLHGMLSGNVTPTPPKTASRYEIVNTFTTELSLLDGLNMPRSITPAPYLLGMLAIIRKDSVKALDFLTAVKEGLGVVNGQEQDAIHIVTSYIQSKDYADLKASKSTGQSNMAVPCAVMLNAFEAWNIDPESAFFRSFPKTTTVVRKFFSTK